MRTSLELLDWFKDAHDIESDYMVWKLTGVSKASLSDVRREKGEFSEHTIMKLLAVGEHPEPLKTFAKIEAYIAEKKGNGEMAKIWNDAAA